MIQKIALCGLLTLFADTALSQALVNCAPSTPCNATTGPSNTTTGDPAWVSFGKINSRHKG